tara:strand:+ start:117 stop:347 length:231 start_codon:yes stop_codon:yes gene_type:complete
MNQIIPNLIPLNNISNIITGKYNKNNNENNYNNENNNENNYNFEKDTFKDKKYTKKQCSGVVYKQLKKHKRKTRRI